MAIDFYKNYKVITRSEWDTKISNLKVITERLTQTLHIFIQVERISDFSAYKKEVEEVLNPLNSHDHMFVLKYMQTYFIERFGEEIKKTGTSTDIKEQIIHRIGKENKHLVYDLFKGFDVQKLVESIYEIRFLPEYVEKKQEILDSLLPTQIEEFNEFLNRYEKILLAKSILKNTGVTNSEINIEALTILLRLRTKEEITQILIEAEILLRKNPYEQINVIDELSTKLSNSELETLKVCLDGININNISKSIVELFRNRGESISVINEVPNIHPDFQGLFLKNASRQSGLKIELELYPKISKVLYSYPEKIRFKIIKDIENQYGFYLTEELYKSDNNFSPMRIASTIKRLSDSAPPRAHYTKDESYLSENDIREIKDLFRRGSSQSLEQMIITKATQARQNLTKNILLRVIEPLLSLTDLQIYQVAFSFKALTGTSLIKYLNNKENIISRGDNSPQALELINLICSGLANFTFDEFKQIVVFDTDDKLSEIANIIHNKEVLNISDRGTKITSIISTLNQLELINLVYIYYKNFKSSLIDKLENEIPLKLFIEVKTQILGLNFHLIEERLEDPKYLCELNRIYPGEAILIQTKFKEKLDKFKDIKDLPLVEIFYHLLTSRAKIARIRKLITSNIQLSEQDSDLLLNLFQNDNSTYLKFSYNYWYSDSSLSFDFDSNTLIQSLKTSANKGIISRFLFVQIISILENIPINLIPKIYNLVIHLKEQDHFEDVLIEYKFNLDLIKKLYNVLDEGKTLRERIYDSELDLTNKNKLLLILDGYNPESVATEINDLIKKYSESELGDKIVRILTTQGEDPSNHRIPKSKNWTSEMYHQIRINYQALFKNELISELKNKNVPTTGLGINWIAYRLYGDISKNVLLFEKALRNSYSELEIQQLVTEHLEELIPELKERFINMYNCYFAKILENDLISKVTSSEIKDKISNLIKI